MNLLTKSIIGLLCITTLAGAYFSYTEHQKNQQWQQQQRGNMQYWSHIQSFYLREFDYSLAEALAAPTVKDRKVALQSAIEKADYISQSTRSASVTRTFDSWFAYDSFVSDASRYLSYPASENGDSLMADQLEQIARLRTFARTALPYLDQLKKKSTTSSLTEIEQISTEMEEALSQFGSVIKYGYKAYNDFMYKQNPYIPLKPGGVFADENTYKATELAAKAKIFMGETWNKGVGKQFVHMSSGGYSVDYGELVGFSLSDSDRKSTSPYTVKMSKSGHVLQVKHMGSYSEKGDVEQPMDIKQIVAIADTWMARWSGERLTLVAKAVKNNSIYLTYIPVREQVSIPQMKVVWQFDRRTGTLKSFDAYNYFSYYNKTFRTQPKLTADQASERLGSQVNITGKPKLKIHNDVLVYVFPISGIEGVSHVYVNASTGASEGIEYTL